MRRKRLSARRSMAVRQTRVVYERLYGERPTQESFDVLSTSELESLAERISQQSRPDTDRVAVLGYN